MLRLLPLLCLTLLPTQFEAATNAQFEFVANDKSALDACGQTDVEWIGDLMGSGCN